jgi:hypothetical protein
MRFNVLRVAVFALALSAAVPAAGEPALFAPDIVSTRFHESAPALSPQGDVIYFARRGGASYFWVILSSRRIADTWSEPEIAPFSGVFNDTDPAFSADGRRLYFVSNRTASGEPQRDYDIWYVEQESAGWSTPRRANGVNSAANEVHPSLDHAGVLYFASDRAGANAFDIYAAAPLARGHDTPIALTSINTPGADTHPAISADGRTLVFTSIGRPDEPVSPGIPYARGDLYLSTRGDGNWGTARRLGSSINSAAAESHPSFTHDGRLLYVSERGFATDAPAAAPSYQSFLAGARSIENGLGNIYSVPLEELGAGP